MQDKDKDILGFCEADYDALIERAEAASTQQRVSQHEAIKARLQQTLTVTSELQTTLQTLDSLHLRGLLSATGRSTAAQEITANVSTNQEQASSLEQALASLQDPDVLDAAMDRLVLQKLSEGCNNSRKRRRISRQP